MKKKLMNDPDNIVNEMVEGFASSYPQYAVVHPENNRVLYKPSIDDDKVAIVSGGGAGHEPSFFGLIGKGLIDGVAVGNVFASPPPTPILKATKSVNNNKGVLYLIINYAGDRMNFDMAADMAQSEGIEVEQVVITDDVASSEEIGERRGIAGAFFVCKVAGAAAQKGYNLSKVAKIARRANDNVRTMGVGLTPCYLPGSSTPNFDIEEQEMEIGLGIHGERGVEKQELKSSDEIATILLNMVTKDISISEGDNIAVLVNGLGATTKMELFVLSRKINQLLSIKKINVSKVYVNEFMTSLEMGGVSLSIIKLDKELENLIKYPANSSAFVQVDERER